ncbi:MAG: extracellular solute-binding protein [Clostridia bacterium]|nr:extracellular solute-binding protein [Clostridia bacterium]
MSKKLLALLLVLVMCVPFIGALADDPVELSIVVRRRDTDITEDFHEKHWVQQTEKELNVKFNFIEISENDYATEVAAILASGKLPDIFFVGNSMPEALVLQNNKLWHVFTEEEIRTKVPNAAAVYDKYIKDWQAYLTYPDGNMYALPSGLLTSYMHTTDKGIMYINKTWLDNLGLAIPTTAEELVEVLRAFKEKDADGDGDPNNEIPYDFCEAFFASKIEFLAWMFGQPVTESVFYNITDEGEVVGAVDTDGYRAFLEYAHQLVEEGLVSIDGFTQTYDQWAANLNSMKVGFFLGWGPCNYITAKEDFLNITGILTPSAEGYTARMYKAKEIRASRNGFIISKDCQNVDAALMVWNYWSDPEMALTVTCGERGLFWEYTDDDYNYRGGTNVPEITDERLVEWGYENLVGKTYTGGNTVGYVNNGPLCPHAESYDEEYLEGWGTQRYVAMKALDAAGLFAPAMNVDIVPTDKQEEYDFTTDGLTSYVQQFVADSVKYGVTDDSWNAFKAGLNTYGYDFYVEFWNAKYHHEL